MKKVGLIGCIAVLLFIGGCGNQNVKQSAKEWDPNSIWDGVAPKGGVIPDFFQGKSGDFPASMVGVWEAEIPDILWDIKFESNGAMLRIVHYVAGALKVEKGGVEANGVDNSYYVFKLGPCEARYSPDTRMLRAKIVIDYFIMKIPAGEIEGRMEDYFEGFVSEDGNRWETQWFSFKWMKGSPPPHVDWKKAHPIPLVFIKLDPTQPREEMKLE